MAGRTTRCESHGLRNVGARRRRSNRPLNDPFEDVRRVNSGLRFHRVIITISLRFQSRTDGPRSGKVKKEENMKRRKFLIGAGAVSLGGAVVIGSGSLSEAEAQRKTAIEVALDSEAYLKIEQHPESDWSEQEPGSSTEFTVGEDEDGHLAITIDAVRNGTTTRFDDVFRVCNAGKQCVCVWMDEKLGTYPERVSFHDSDTGDSIEGKSGSVQLRVGECVDIGIETDAEGLDGRNNLLDGATLKARADCPCSSTEVSEETAWGDGDEFPGANWFTYFEYDGGKYTTDLVTGRYKKEVGEVSVEEVGDNIEVTYTTNSDSEMVETHLAVADEQPEANGGNEWHDNGWLNNGGNPVPGRFPEGDVFGSGVEEKTYTVDVSDESFPVYVGAHAVVQETGGI